MKLTWTTILLSSILLMLFINACNNADNSNVNKKNGENVSLSFVDSLTQKKISNFQFGISTNKEELPIEEILKKNIKNFVIKNNTVIIKNPDTVYGYFVKRGYKSTKFLITNNLENRTIGIFPEPSLIIIKAMDKSVSSEIDSINVIFEIKKKDTRKKELYKFKRSDVDLNLEYFSKYIEHNQSIKLNIDVFSKGKYYNIRRVINYVPWTDVVIKII